MGDKTTELSPVGTKRTFSASDNLHFRHQLFEALEELRVRRVSTQTSGYVGQLGLKLDVIGSRNVGIHSSSAVITWDQKVKLYASGSLQELMVRLKIICNPRVP